MGFFLALVERLHDVEGLEEARRRLRSRR
jgi:hypothetical protein